MSSNPVEYAKERLILSQSLIPNLYETLKSKSDSWESVYQGYRILLRQIHTSAEIISRQVGGVYVNRGYMSDSKKRKVLIKLFHMKTKKNSIKILNKYYF